MTTEMSILVASLVLLVLIMLFQWLIDRNHKKRIEELEEHLDYLLDRNQKQLEQRVAELRTQLHDEIKRSDENAQKRHNYLKKSFNDINDRIDLVEQTDKKATDLYYQLERYNNQLSELTTLLPRPTMQSSHPVEHVQKPRIDPEIQEVLELRRQGLSPEEIAQKLGRAVPEIHLVLKLLKEAI